MLSVVDGLRRKINQYYAELGPELSPVFDVVKAAEVIRENERRLGVLPNETHRDLFAGLAALESAQGAEQRPQTERITHGRHCRCSACAREDWTQPHLAPCGMHGSSCPLVYAPLGAPGDLVSASGAEQPQTYQEARDELDRIDREAGDP